MSALLSLPLSPWPKPPSMMCWAQRPRFGSRTSRLVSPCKNDKIVKTNTNLKIKRILLFPLRFFKKSIFIRRRSLSLGCPICCPAVSFNKDKVKTPLFENPDFRSDVDWQAWETLSKVKGKFLFNTKACMFHRVHDDSETTKVIADNKRTKEDMVMFRKFWPECIAKVICKLYANSEKSNSN